MENDDNTLEVLKRGWEAKRAGGQVPNEDCLLALFCQSPDKMNKYVLCGKSVLPQKLQSTWDKKVAENLP